MADQKQRNRRILYDYERFKNLEGRYNKGKVEADIFTLYRIKDGTIITAFNIKTFETVKSN